jgi:hypothetical protein
MDGDALASAGWGTDEDYGHFGDDFWWLMFLTTFALPATSSSTLMKVASCGKALCSVRTATLKSAQRIVKSASLAEAYHRWVGQATASVPTPRSFYDTPQKIPSNVGG